MPQTSSSLLPLVIVPWGEGGKIDIEGWGRDETGGVWNVELETQRRGAGGGGGDRHWLWSTHVVVGGRRKRRMRLARGSFHRGDSPNVPIGGGQRRTGRSRLDSRSRWGQILASCTVFGRAVAVGLMSPTTYSPAPPRPPLSRAGDSRRNSMSVRSLSSESKQACSKDSS